MIIRTISYIKKRIKWWLRGIQIRKELSVKSSTRRIIYAITPPAKLSNLGDQAQVVAIYDWLVRHEPSSNIIEIDKDEVINCVNFFKGLINPSDVIVLHSGGNMGDRGMWSETSRRTMISNFPNNKVLSLPQTINFRDTPFGKEQLEITKKIYNAHPDLTVIARDNQSYKLATSYFTSCKIDKAPDFVLSYNVKHLQLETAEKNGKVLFCLREDDESAIDSSARSKLINSIKMQYDIFDTTLPDNISKNTRKQHLDATLKMFSEYDYVITDRFHGLIFSVLTQRPTVVLPTVDHKLTSAFDWFSDISFVKFSPTVDDVAATLDEVKLSLDFSTAEWDALYFDKVAQYLVNS